jgi:hypothetical protein
MLDEEIEKMAAWNIDDEPPHSEWISTSTVQSTGEVFGLIDPASSGGGNTTDNDEADTSFADHWNKMVITPASRRTQQKELLATY